VRTAVSEGAQKALDPQRLIDATEEQLDIPYKTPLKS
jgi:hypothetical protein